jgi:hypothetical protein
MDFISLLPQNAGPVTKSKFKDASRKVQMLRNRGLAADADLLAGDIAGAIQSGDMTAIGSTIKSLDDYYKKAPKPQVATREEKEQPPEYGSEELAMRIQDSIALADERGIDLPNSDLSRLSSFVAKGDTKRASAQLAKVSSFIDKSLAIQTEEEKKPKVLADGAQIEIGSKSGTRYMGGQPVSKGAINSDVFNSMYQKNASTQQEQFAGAGVPIVSSIPLEPSQRYQVAPVEGVVAQPEVYTQEVQTAPTSIEEKQITMRKASEAYKAGNDEEAVILMNAAGGKGLTGVFTKTDLPDVFGERGQSKPKPPETNLPSSIEVKGKTFNRPKEFTDQEWDEYIKAQNK